jgi:hypothetical protein
VPPSSLPEPTEVAPTRGPSIDHLRLVAEGVPDTDGDGSPDGTPESLLGDNQLQEVVLHRADGVVRFRNPGGHIFPQRQVAWWGDFDADGRDDVVLTALHQPDGRAYLVPGTIAPGEYDLPAVGIGLPAEFDFATQVGDQDGDGADDFALWLDNRIQVVSGRAVATGAAPGDSLAERPPTLFSVPAELIDGYLRLHESGPPTIVTADSVDPTTFELTVHTDPSIRLRTARVDVIGPSAISGFLSGGHRVVELSEGTRSGSAFWQWDLDDPCRQPVPLAPPPEPPPPPEPEPVLQTHTVQPGEWLWRIAREALTARSLDASAPAVHRYVDEIYARNVTVIGPDPNRILPGMVLVLPSR